MGKLLSLLTMFGPLSAAKFWVAVAMALSNFVNVYWGVDIGLDQGTAAQVINGVGAALIWLLPNKGRELPMMTREEALRSNNAATGRNQSHIPRR